MEIQIDYYYRALLSNIHAHAETGQLKVKK